MLTVFTRYMCLAPDVSPLSLLRAISVRFLCQCASSRKFLIAYIVSFRSVRNRDPLGVGWNAWSIARQFMKCAYVGHYDSEGR